MTAYYDSVANEYEDILELPIAKYIKEYFFPTILGDITSKSILDFGCGEGIYTRKFKQMGAGRVVGIDISEKLIEKAKLKESQEQLGIEYIVSDGTGLDKIDTFDLVASAYVINLAQNKENLLDMCCSIFANLKLGGRFVSILTNLEQHPDTYHVWEKYGLIKTISEPLREGTPITYTSVSNGIKLYDYYHSRATYEWAFKTAGFTEIRWLPIMGWPKRVKESGEEFWQDYFNYELDVVIECFK